MKGEFLCVLLVTFLSAAVELLPPERPYEILMLLPLSSRSHRNVFLPLANALVDRGHKIVMLSNNRKPVQRPNFTEICPQMPYFDESKVNTFEMRKDGIGGFSYLRTILPPMARHIYQVPEVRELYERRKEFDLVITDHMLNEVIYPFAYEMLFITISATGMDYRHSAVLGNPLSPAYADNLPVAANTSTLMGRLLNTFVHFYFSFYWRTWEIVPSIQKEISAHFPDLPPLLEIERNQSLTLLNSHFSMDMSLPLLPTQVEVGCIQCRPAEPLPDPIRSWIEGAGSAGVIYFSLGSIVHADSMPVKYRDMFVQAFKKMKQRILWKFERDVEGISDNVMISKWLPQQDVLGHPNVKVFITHGGLLSLQESSYHGTPLLALPVFSEQPRNGMNIIKSGLGLSLAWEELTVELIVKSLQEIIDKPKYRENAAEVSRLFKDQLTSPLERAVFWTEYVIRHKGAPHLRSPAAELSWVEFLLLDVLVVVLIILALFLILLKLILRRFLQRVFGKNKMKHE